MSQGRDLHHWPELWVGRRQTIDEAGLPEREGSEQQANVLWGERTLNLSEALCGKQAVFISLSKDGFDFLPEDQNLPLMVTLPSIVTTNGNLDFDWLLSFVTMVVAIDGKVTVNGKFYCDGAHIAISTDIIKHNLS